MCISEESGLTSGPITEEGLLSQMMEFVKSQISEPIRLKGALALITFPNAGPIIIQLVMRCLRVVYESLFAIELQLTFHAIKRFQ